MEDRPNVILIVLDTARRDAFAPYDPTKDTPAIAQIASRGTAYPYAISNSCWTAPSHAGMLMGDPPRSVGICRVIEGSLCVPVIAKQRSRYLPHVFKQAGYETRGVSANSWITKRNGFDLGFDEFHDVTGLRNTKMASPGLRAGLSWYLDAIRATADDGIEAIEKRLSSWANARLRPPFFWFVNLMECHSPYMPPKPFNDMGVVQRLAAARDGRRYYTLLAVFAAVATGKVPNKRVTRRLRHLYDLSVMQMDRSIARLLELLDRTGVLDETIVVVTADHGENFSENGLIAHVASLDDRLLRVPLVMCGPGVQQAPAGAVGLDSLPKLLAGLAGIEHPWKSRWPEGVVVSQYDGPVQWDDPRADYLREMETIPERIERLTQKYASATNGALKLVRRIGGATSLYDLATDPLETNPLPLQARPAPELATLVQALDQADAEAWDETVEGATGEMPADLEERMKLLGYM